jgi:hypothetical protein
VQPAPGQLEPQVLLELPAQPEPVPVPQALPLLRLAPPPSP